MDLLPPDSTSNKRRHVRFTGNQIGSMQVLDRETESIEAEAQVQVLNASFTGAKLALRDLPAVILANLEKGKFIVRLRVTREEETLELLGGLPVWTTSQPGRVTMGVSWHHSVPHLLRMQIVEWTHLSAPPPRTIWPWLVGAVVCGFGLAIVLLLTPQVSRLAGPLPSLIAERAKRAPTTSGTAAEDAKRVQPLFSANAVPSQTDVFGKIDLQLTTEMSEGSLIGLRAATLTGRHLQVELAPKVVLPEGKKVFATLSVTDGLNNTLLDCTWRDLGFSGSEPQTVGCDLSQEAAGPLSISGSQTALPSFFEPALEHRDVDTPLSR